MLSVVLNTIFADASNMRHFSHNLIKIKPIPDNKVIRDNEAAIVALVATTERSILFAQNARLQ